MVKCHLYKVTGAAQVPVTGNRSHVSSELLPEQPDNDSPLNPSPRRGMIGRLFCTIN